MLQFPPHPLFLMCSTPHTLIHSRIGQILSFSSPSSPSFMKHAVLLGVFSTHTHSICIPSFCNIGNAWEDVCGKRLTFEISLPP